MSSDPIKTYGWTALPRDPSIVLNGKKNVKSPAPVKVDSISLPATELAKAVMKYAKNELKEETFNHSMRVYYYGKLVFLSQGCRVSHDRADQWLFYRPSNPNPAISRLAPQRRNLPTHLPPP